MCICFCQGIPDKMQLLPQNNKCAVHAAADNALATAAVLMPCPFMTVVAADWTNRWSSQHYGAS